MFGLGKLLKNYCKWLQGRCYNDTGTCTYYVLMFTLTDNKARGTDVK